MAHPRAAFRHRDFRYFIASRFLALVAYPMLIVAVSQSVYEMTRNPLHLGYIGLALFIPKIGFTLPAGHVADRFDRRTVLFASRGIQLLAMFGLIFFFLVGGGSLPFLYAFLFLMGTGSAFGAPASQALVTQLVPEADFNNAVAWNSSSMQIAFIAGPALGGWFYAVSNSGVAVLSVVCLLWTISTLLLIPIRPRRDHIEKTNLSWQSVLAGLHYVFKTRLILGTISLDLFAVLLGGAVALMPVFANDILHVGPTGLGALRTAPAVGAAAMSVLLAYRPPLRQAGPTMLACVAVFGLATILFGLSRNFWFSIGCLVVLGAADMVSVVIRHVLVQVKTPPSMRGRVSAVNMIFIGASNELGEFESGLTASWFGTVPAVVIGGLGTLAVVGLYAWRFPEIRAYDRLNADAASVKESITVSGEEKKTL